MKEENIISKFIIETMPENIPKIIIDVGANSAAILSEPFIEMGWKSILIEPQEECAKSLREKYPNQIVIEKACSNKKTTMPLYLAKSGDTEVATLNTNNDPWFDEVRGEDYVLVNVDTLTNILDECDCPKHIGILKIDCESYDPMVIESLDFEKYSPEFVVTEEYYWEPINLKAKYEKLENEGYVLLGYVEYNSIWRKKSNHVNYTSFILKDFLKIHKMCPNEFGNLSLVGKWKD